MFKNYGMMAMKLVSIQLREYFLFYFFLDSKEKMMTKIQFSIFSHRQPELWWTFNATMEDWFDEFAGMANIINRFAGIPLDELRGTRVPFLRVGWNTQFIMVRLFEYR